MAAFNITVTYPDDLGAELLSAMRWEMGDGNASIEDISSWLGQQAANRAKNTLHNYREQLAVQANADLDTITGS
jgi:hypothetical protein